jgi:hypothetical protein
LVYFSFYLFFISSIGISSRADASPVDGKSGSPVLNLTDFGKVALLLILACLFNFRS